MVCSVVDSVTTVATDIEPSDVAMLTQKLGEISYLGPERERERENERRRRSERQRDREKGRKESGRKESGRGGD